MRSPGRTAAIFLAPCTAPWPGCSSITRGAGLAVARSRSVPRTSSSEALPQTLDREPAQVVALLEALAALRQTHPQWVEALEHRYYGGLTLEETARMMDVDERTLRRWWDRGRLVLAEDILARMNADPAGESRP